MEVSVSESFLKRFSAVSIRFCFCFASTAATIPPITATTAPVASIPDKTVLPSATLAPTDAVAPADANCVKSVVVRIAPFVAA